MTDEAVSTIEVEFTPEFKRNLRTLARKYRKIRSDVKPIISEIQRPIGLAKDIFQVPESFFDELPDELLDAFEAKGELIKNHFLVS
jgi:mRNA-degrading endonuclease RelE of RelBE toxin-antitoxin system